MSYSCLEELQVAFDLSIDKTSILSNAGGKYNDGWIVVTDDGICHLFDKDGNLDDIKKVTHLKGNHIRKNIKKIVIPNSVIHIENWAFSGCSWLTSVTIGNSVTSIGDGVFNGCDNLTNVTIPNNVTSIGRDAFYWCNGLTSIMIPDSVTSIGDYTFEYCSGLMSVTIGNSVKSIGEYAFGDCNKLANLTFKDKTLEQVKAMRYYPWGIEDESIISVG